MQNKLDKLWDEHMLETLIVQHESLEQNVADMRSKRLEKNRSEYQMRSPGPQPPSPRPLPQSSERRQERTRSRSPVRQAPLPEPARSQNSVQQPSSQVPSRSLANTSTQSNPKHTIPSLLLSRESDNWCQLCLLNLPNYPSCVCLLIFAALVDDAFHACVFINRVKW